MKNSTNPAMNGLWTGFNKKYATALRAHRAKFLPDDAFNCHTLAKVKREAVEGEGIPIGTVVTVVQVGAPQISNEFIWRRINRPYVSAVVKIGRKKQTTCNLEALQPV